MAARRGCKEVTPLKVTAELSGFVELGPAQLWPALDGILAAAVARSNGMIPPVSAADVLPIEIPVEREPGGRFHLATMGIPDDPRRDTITHLHRTPPVRQFTSLLDPVAKFRRVDITAEPDKQLRIPKAATMIARVHWWCVGEHDGIESLLRGVTRIGARRRHGRGAVTRWDIYPADPWDGFPVVRDGGALRNLPMDWPGLVEPIEGFANLTFPFWMREREELLAVPGWPH